MDLLRVVGARGLLIASLLASTAIASAQTPNDPNDPDTPVSPDHIFATGLLPDTPEQTRSVKPAPIYRNFLPERVDLSYLMPRPGNQGRQGSCVGWAVGYAARAYYSGRDGRSVRDNNNIPSPAYIYNAIRDPNEDCNGGSSLIVAFWLLRDQGAASLARYPYSVNSCTPPSQSMRKSMSEFRIEDIEYVDHKKIDQVKGALAKSNPVVIAMRTSNAFHHWRGPGVYRGGSSFTSGSHAVTVVGYDEVRQAFRIINSWGTHWGDGGYIWIGYRAFTDEVLSAWTMRVKQEAPPSPAPPPVVVIPKPAPAPEPKPVVVVPSPAPQPKPQPDPSPAPQPAQECSLVKKTEEDGKAVLTGFAGSDDQLARLKAEHKDADIRVAVRPWPQCETLLTLDKFIERSDRPTVKIRKQGETLAAGEQLVMELDTPSYPAYLHAAYIQADGSVVNLLQQMSVMPANSKIQLGTGSAAEGGRTFKVSAPYGREMLVVLTGRAPIFSETRPKIETERDFLTALRAALIAKIDPDAPDRDVAANFDTVVTAEKKTP